MEQTQLKFDSYSLVGKKANNIAFLLYKSLFGRLYLEINKDTEIFHKLSNKSKLINILYFLYKQKIF